MTAKNGLGSARRDSGFRRDSVRFPVRRDGRFFGAIWLFFRAVKIDKAVYIRRDVVGFPAGFDGCFPRDSVGLRRGEIGVFRRERKGGRRGEKPENIFPKKPRKTFSGKSRKP